MIEMRFGRIDIPQKSRYTFRRYLSGSACAQRSFRGSSVTGRHL